MAKNTEMLTKAQAMYKTNYDARLQNRSDVIHVDDYVYLCVQRKDQNEHPYKPAPTTEGPYKVLKLDSNTVVIGKNGPVRRKSIRFSSRVHSETVNAERSRSHLKTHGYRRKALRVFNEEGCEYGRCR